MAHASTTTRVKSNAQPKAAKAVSTSTKKIVSVEKKAKKSVPAPQIKQPKAKPTAIKIKAKPQKPDKTVSVKKSAVVAVKKKPKTLMPILKPKSKKLETKAPAIKKASIKLQTKDSAKKSKLVKSQKIETQKKNALAQPLVAIKKKASAKSVASVSVKKTDSAIKKNASKTKQDVAKKSVKAPVISVAKKTKAVKSPTIVKAAKKVASTQVRAAKKSTSAKIKVVAPRKKNVVEPIKLKETSAPKVVKNKFKKVADVKKQKTKSVEEFGINTRKYSLLRTQKPQSRQENSNIASEAIKLNQRNILPNDKNVADKNFPVVKAVRHNGNELRNASSESKSVVSKSKNKKAKAIGAAVFRGKKERYDFEVFPIDAEFEDVSAIYIISKRKIDKRKRAHHALVCIGQTDSLVAELKKHRKGKCVKKFAANSISLLREENEKQRLKIETDLKAAHAIPCVHI